MVESSHVVHDAAKRAGVILDTQTVTFVISQPRGLKLFDILAAFDKHAVKLCCNRDRTHRQKVMGGIVQGKIADEGDEKDLTKNDAEQTENAVQSSKPPNASAAEHIRTKLDDVNSDSIILETGTAQTKNGTKKPVAVNPKQMMHQQYLDRQYLAELLPIDQQYLVSGADMHSLLCDVVLPRPLMWRAFVRDFIFGKVNELKNILRRGSAKNVILSRGNAPEICHALLASGLHSSFDCVADTKAVAFWPRAGYSHDVDTAYGNQRALKEAFVFNQALKQAYPRGCSKDRFIREQFECNFDLLLPDWVCDVVSKTCKGSVIHVKVAKEDNSQSRFVWLANNLATINWCAGTAKQTDYSSMVLSSFCDVRVDGKPAEAEAGDSDAAPSAGLLVTLVHSTDVASNLELDFSGDKEVCGMWVRALSYLLRGRIVYVDDNIERRWLPGHVLTVQLEQEGSGITGPGAEQALTMAGVDLNTLRSTDIVIWDFDCTLSSVHLYKTLHMDQIHAWRQTWSPPVSSWWQEQCRMADIKIR